MQRQDNYARRREDYEGTSVKRNPYLVSYEGQRSRQGRERQSYGKAASGQSSGAISVYGYGSEEEEMPVGRRTFAEQEGPVRRNASVREVSARRRVSTGEEAPVRRKVSVRTEEQFCTYDNESVGYRKETRGGGGRADLDIIGLDEPAAHRRAHCGPDVAAVTGRRSRPYGESGGSRRPAVYENSGRRPGREEISENAVYEVRLHRNFTDTAGARIAAQGGNNGRSSRREPDSGTASYRQIPDRSRVAENSSRNRGYTRTTAVRSGQARQTRPEVGTAVRRTNARRRKRVMRQRLMVSVWALCIIALGAAFVIRNHRAEAAGNAQENDAGGLSGLAGGAMGQQTSGRLVQGLPAEVYEKHPDWEENFLTPNEYSRPGDALESVTNVFVHYTANPGTSAAQNRSYFEQQKDTHEASVSAHFIIGYNGEIIQCVPLDEIAYAVMTRNYDSVSIECCYKAQDGSFTQETYDSLISLLAWLTDAYGLDTEDILRHYDCGGKKCPLYYTEHEDAWERLKKDVDNL